MAKLPAKADFLQALKEWSPTDRSSEDYECEICWNLFEQPCQFRCSHVFCQACALTWLETANTCPTCRTELYLKEPKAEEASDWDWNGDWSPGEDLEGWENEWQLRSANDARGGQGDVPRSNEANGTSTNDADDEKPEQSTRESSQDNHRGCHLYES